MSAPTAGRGLPLPGRSGRAGLRERLRPSGPWTSEALVLLALVGTLLAIGLVMSLSASFAADSAGGGAFSTFQRQAAWAVIGAAGFAAAARTDHRVWRPLSWVLLAVSVVGLGLVLTPLGLEQYGSVRWIRVGPAVVQPSELAKLAALLFLADVAARKRRLAAGREMPLRHLLVPAVPLLVLLATLVMLQPDLGTTLLLGLIVGTVLWLEGVPGRLVALGAGIAAAGTGLAIATASYRLGRIRGWLRAEEFADRDGYQLLQSLYALGDGGVLGVGLGSGRGKWSFIPNPDTDFIFAILGEELGLVGALTVVLLFAGVLVVGLRIARQADDVFGSLVAAGITIWLVGQAFVNISTVIGLLPITGVTLPLLSVGGSSLVSTLVAFGILASIARAGGRAGDDAREVS